MRALKENIGNYIGPSIVRNITSYRPGFIILRFLIISVVAVGILHFIVALVPEPENLRRPLTIHYIIVIIAFSLTGEVQILLDLILEKNLPVPNKIRIRLGIQLIGGVIVLMIIHSIVMMIASNLISGESRLGVYLGLMFGLFFIYMFANSLIYTRFMEKWVESQNKIEEMENEKLRMDYNSLQNQLNPHFLFNNLSVLKSLITFDRDSALDFIENFTDVYRYVLRCKDKPLISLKEELDFIKSYIGLHKERLGEGLIVHYHMTERDLNREIAPLTLQLLIENAIKHNIAKNEKPLEIDIGTEADYLYVSNTLQLRNSSYSTNTGLRNLVKMYQMLSSKEVDIIKNEQSFIVKVPLL